MKQIDSDSLQMFKSVSNTMNKNKLIWKDNQLVCDCVDKLNANILIINNAYKGLLETPSIITLKKKELRDKLNSLTFLVKEGLRIYYSLNNMTEDMQVFTFPITKFTRMPDANFYLDSLHISDKAEGLATQLAPIGITPAKIAKLKADLMVFYNLHPERDISIKTRANLVKLIPQKVKETKQMLKKNLDAVVPMYDDDANKSFIITYFLSRKIHAKPGRKKFYSVLIKGTIKDSETKEVLVDVSVEAGVKKKKVISGTDGFFSARIYNKDADVLIFILEGYETLIINIPKKQVNHEVIVNVELKKIVKIEELDI